jgi:hypothetical protein
LTNLQTGQLAEYNIYLNNHQSQFKVRPALNEETNVPDEQRVANNSQTYVVDADTFSYETVEQQNGQATVVRFQLEDSRYHAGDVVVVLSEGEIHFHGMIGRLADGWATATDRRGSLLPATVQ